MKEPEANSWPQEDKRVMRQSDAGEQASKRKAQSQQTADCRARRREGKDWLLTRGDPDLERGREVSRGRSSKEVWRKPDERRTEERKNEAQ